MPVPTSILVNCPTLRVLVTVFCAGAVNAVHTVIARAQMNGMIFFMLYRLNVLGFLSVRRTIVEKVAGLCRKKVVTLKINSAR